jgi:hypothetical protein
MVEAATAEEARQIILADLDVDPAYDDDLEPVESGVGDMKVTQESRHDPAQIPESVAS